MDVTFDEFDKAWDKAASAYPQKESNNYKIVKKTKERGIDIGKTVYAVSNGSQYIKTFDDKESAQAYIDKLTNKSLGEALVDPTEEDIKSFEDILTAYGYEIERKGKTWFGNIHYQVILPGSIINDPDEIQEIVEPLVDEIDN